MATGPRSLAATRMKGASQPAPIAASMSSASSRASFEVGSCAALGGPVFSASTGSASSTSAAPITPAARRGRARAAPTAAISRLPSLFPPNRQRLTLGPSRKSSGGATTVAMATLIRVTRIAVPARERKSDPGMIQRIATIARTRVEPAKAVVRPAV